MSLSNDFALILVTLATFSAISVISCQSNNVQFVECGRRLTSYRNGRIVGGTPASEGENPWMVSVTFNGFHTCGGTILSRDYVLTAAHCVINYSPAHYSVKAGTIFNLGLGSTGVIVRVARIYIHPRFSAHNFYLNDIAILQLAYPLKYNEYVLPACLPVHGVSYTNYMATALGLGFTKETDNLFSPTLRQVEVEIISNSECSSWYVVARQQQFHFARTQICAGYAAGGRDSCYGDSGGPLLITCPRGRITIVGVVSAGIGCGRPLLPGLYTRVSSYNNWIRNITRIRYS